MKCFWYRIIHKKTGKIIVENFGWARSFKDIQESSGNGNIFKVVEIANPNFKI